MRINSSERGFSLIEVMIAFVVLLVGMLGIMGMQYYAVAGNATSRELRMATNLGQDMIESLQALPYATLASSTDIPTSGVALTGGLVYTRRWWVVPNCVELSADANICTTPAGTCATSPGAVAVPVAAIRARVCWTDKNGGVHAVTLDSIRWDDATYF